MSRCVDDRTLWLLSEGDASRESRVHVLSCTTCTARLRRLEQDLSSLRSVLTGPPSLPEALARGRAMRGRWLASAAALAAIVVLAWFGVWWQGHLPSRSIETHQESIWPFIEGVSATLFSNVESGLPAPLERVSDLDDLQAALADAWLCEELAEFVNGTCDEDTLSVLFEDQ